MSASLRSRWLSGKIRYQVPPGMEPFWDGKKQIAVGIRRLLEGAGGDDSIGAIRRLPKRSGLLVTGLVDTLWLMRSRLDVNE